MSHIASIPILHSAAACLRARTGAFVLPAAQALALRPKQDSYIRITCGSAWVTINDGVDYFLAAGQTMTAPAGSRVVMESMRRDGSIKFDWLPVVQAQREQSQLREGTDALVMEAGLSPFAQALRDLRGAADLAVRGLGGLAAALARSADSSANRAQGRMAS